MIPVAILFTALALRPLAPAGVYVEGEKPTFERMGTSFSSYCIRDFYGHIRGSGEWPAGQTVLELPCADPGYYEIELRSGTNDSVRSSYSVVRDPILNGGRDPDSFFATMVAFARRPDPGNALGAWQGGDVDEILSRVLSLGGITEARVMWWWNRIEPIPGEFDDWWWRRAAALYRKRNVGLCAFGHTSPCWVDKSGKLPRDFTALVRFCRHMERENAASMTAWEFGNEPEGCYTTEGAWNFAAVSKAAYLAFKAENPNRIVSSAAFCSPAGLSGFDVLWYESGGAYYSDFFNFHDYEIYPLPMRYRACREMLSRYGIGDQAIWVTENGTDLEGCAKVLKGDGKFYHSREQEAIHAEACLKGEFRLMQEGVSRCYHFYMSRHHERGGTKDWGDFRYDGTLKPFYVAHSVAADVLKRATLKGRVHPAEDVVGYLFENPRGSQTLVYWSESDVDRNYPATLDKKGSSVADSDDILRKSFILEGAEGECCLTLMMGERRMRTAKEGSMTLVATRYPAYVTGNLGQMPVEPAVPRGRIGARKPEADLDTTIVIRADESPEQFGLGEGRTRAEMRGDRGGIRFEVWNLSDAEKNGSLAWTGTKVDGVPANLKLPPWGKFSFEGEIVHDAHWTNATARLVMTGTFNGRRTTPFVLPIFAVDHFFDGRELVELPQWRDPVGWQVNDSGKNHSIVWDELEQAVRIDVEFEADVEGWMFPRYKVAPEVGYLLDGAKGLSFEIKAAQTRIENQWKSTFVQLESPLNVNRAGWIRYRAPVGNWEHRMVTFGDGQIARDVSAIAIGGLPLISRKAQIWIRNIRVVR